MCARHCQGRMSVLTKLGPYIPKVGCGKLKTTLLCVARWSIEDDIIVWPQVACQAQASLCSSLLWEMPHTSRLATYPALFQGTLHTTNCILHNDRCTLLTFGYSSQVWIHYCQTYPKVYKNMFRVKPRATLGPTVWKKVKSPQWLSQKCAFGSSDFPSGLRPTGKSDGPWEFLRANFSRQPLRPFHCLYHNAHCKLHSARTKLCTAKSTLKTAPAHCKWHTALHTIN